MLWRNYLLIKICYDIHGERYPFLLVHGFTSKKEMFVAQVPELSKKNKVIRLDNLGDYPRLKSQIKLN